MTAVPSAGPLRPEALVAIRQDSKVRITGPAIDSAPTVERSRSSRTLLCVFVCTGSVRDLGHPRP